MIDMGRVYPYRSFTVCVKTRRGTNNKTFSLYSNKLSLDSLYNVLYMMIFNERDKYIDVEKRYTYSNNQNDLSRVTHKLQIFKFVENRCVSSRSFGFIELAYNSNEIADIIEIWLKKDMRKERGLTFPNGKVKDYIKSNIRC